VAGLLAVGVLSVPAFADTPGFEPDPNVQGSITFYNASGNVVTSGSDLNHLFDYAVASTAATRPTTKATLFFAFPDHTKADSSTWAAAAASASTNYPDGTAPGAVGTATNPTVSVASTDANLAGPLGSATLDATPGYANILQIRLKDSGAGIGNGILSKPFWATDIQIDQGAGTWSQVFPAPVNTVATAVSAITANPVSPAPDTTTSVALSASLSTTDSTHPGGSVHLFNGATDLGAATLTAATGAIAATATVAAGHGYAFQFKYTPATGYGASSSAVLSYSVTAALPPPLAITYVYIATSRVRAAVYVNGLVKQSSPTVIIRSANRTVYLQRYLNGWQNMLSRPTSAAGQMAVGFIQPRPFVYRLVVVQSAAAFGGASAPTIR
jgi:hypothetical protein